MAEAATSQPPSLSERYLLEKEDKPNVVSKPVEIKEEEKPISAVSEEFVSQKTEVIAESAAEEKTEDTPAAAATGDENTENIPAAAPEESNDINPASAESSSENAAATAEESGDTTEEANSGEKETGEETPEMKLETAPADFRFPTTNQTRHCFTRYIEYHRCIAAKGEGASECEKFAKYYRSLCPDEWVERWNEQRENGTFPGPL